jgi:hypothetical protein
LPVDECGLATFDILIQNTVNGNIVTFPNPNDSVGDSYNQSNYCDKELFVYDSDGNEITVVYTDPLLTIDAPGSYTYKWNIVGYPN